jgi:hypothetical protein
MLKWTKLAGGPPCASDNCPAVYLVENGQLLVQGRRANDEVRTALTLQAGEDVVEISRDLLQRAIEALRQSVEEH